MSEFTDLLEHARERFPAPELPLERVVVRRERQVRNQRIAAGTLAITLVVASVGAAVVLARHDRDTPGGGGEVVEEPTVINGPCFAEDPCWDTDMFVVGTDGTEVTRLGYDEGRDHAYSWSADASASRSSTASGSRTGSALPPPTSTRWGPTARTFAS